MAPFASAATPPPPDFVWAVTYYDERTKMMHEKSYLFFLSAWYDIFFYMQSQDTTHTVQIYENGNTYKVGSRLVNPSYEQNLSWNKIQKSYDGTVIRVGQIDGQQFDIVKVSRGEMLFDRALRNLDTTSEIVEYNYQEKQARELSLLQP